MAKERWAIKARKALLKDSSIAGILCSRDKAITYTSAGCLGWCNTMIPKELRDRRDFVNTLLRIRMG